MTENQIGMKLLILGVGLSLLVLPPDDSEYIFIANNYQNMGYTVKLEPVCS